MPYQVIVRVVKPSPSQLLGDAPNPKSDPAQIEAWSAAAKSILGITRESGEQIYEQTVDVLDLSKLIAAVNAKPRKARAAK